MESVRTATQLIHVDSHMCTLDLQDAYYHVPIHPASQKFLRFSVLSPEGSVLHFQFCALPFGISSAPRVFTKIMVEVVAFLRLQNISIIPYLDDFLIIGKDRQSLLTARESSLKILSELGWLINLKKSSLTPSTQKTFLGVILNSTHQMSFLPQEKMINIKDQIHSLRRRDSISVRQAMKTLGLLTACLPAVAWSQSHTRILQNWILSSWNKKSSGLDKKIRIPSFVKRDLLWWMESTNLEKGVHWHHLPNITIITDASSSGWGAVFPSHFEQGSWTASQAKKSSNYRELRAVWEALKSNSLPERSSHTHTLGQRHNSILPKETRGYKIPGTIKPGSHHLLMGGRKHPFHLGHSSERDPKQRGGLSQQEGNPTQRMVPQPGSFSTSNHHLGYSPNRLVRHKGQYKVPEILFSGGQRVQGLHGCVQPSLERKSSVCLSPYSLSRKGPEEDLARRGEGDLDLPKLAKKKLVPVAEISMHSTTSNPSGSERPPEPRPDTSSRSGKSPTGGLDPESEFLRSQGLSRAVMATLKASRKKVTFTIYYKIWKKFVTFCGANPPVQTNPNILQVLDFLQRGLEIGLSSSTLKVQISALSAFFDHPLADHRIVLTLDPSFVPKVVSDFHRNQEIILPSFCGNPSSSKEMAWHSLDVRRSVLAYLQATESWRKDHNLCSVSGEEQRGKGI
ncbi:uncharacterized protein [Engystomops pustulosus]|uniref:uncharacterized protein isoform X1 n=1 Tax=Engystomops pustulosus TaxID=76066 RepID=UPI003AFA5625